jgi:hypothetical protein
MIRITGKIHDEDLGDARFRVDLQDEQTKNLTAILTRIHEHREEILTAFIAKYGCHPDDVIQYEQELEPPNYGKRWWIERICRSLPGVVSEAIRELMDIHQTGQRGVADIIKIDRAYLWRLKTGRLKNPSDDVLRKLGIERVVTVSYRKIRP